MVIEVASRELFLPYRLGISIDISLHDVRFPFSRTETWSEVPLSPPGSPLERSDLPKQRVPVRCQPTSAKFPTHHLPLRKTCRAVRRPPTDAAGMSDDALELGRMDCSRIDVEATCALAEGFDWRIHLQHVDGAEIDKTDAARTEKISSHVGGPAVDSAPIVEHHVIGAIGRDGATVAHAVGKSAVNHEDPARNAVRRAGWDTAVAVDGQSGLAAMRPATAAVMSGAFLKTGDLGRCDQDGFIYIVDRKNDMVITGGENVFPTEVEEVLLAEPSVLEAAVFGVPDPVWIERLVAAVVLQSECRLTGADVIKSIKGKIAGYKCPKEIYVRDSLPKNAVGKILRKELRREYGSKS